MTYEQVESFLAAVTCGNISAAADYLFVSQSTVSSRIQLLEQELGIPLLIRQKGHRSIELTSHGQSFIPIAEQWAALWKDTQNLKTMADIQTLHIASIDAINNYTFLPLFNQHMERYPNIRLSVNTFHSLEIHGLVQDRSMDMGFVFRQIRYPDVISKPVYCEQMYLICHKDSPYYDGIHPGRLDPGNEIFLQWGPDYQQWHDRHWDPALHALITVNTGSMLRHYLTKPGRWAIAPMSVIQAMDKPDQLARYCLEDGPEPRTCYQLTNRYSRTSRLEAIEIFDQEVEAFVARNPSLRKFDPSRPPAKSSPAT